MGPSVVPKKFPDVKGSLGEIVKQADQFREDALMAAKHCQDKINKLISVCNDMDTFLQEHMLIRHKKRKKIENEIKPIKSRIKLYRKRKKKTKSKKIKNKMISKIKFLKKKIEKLEKKAKRYDPI